MVVYEVNLKVKAEAADSFMKWLPGHMERVLKARGFVQASLFQEEREEKSEKEEVRLTVIYKVKTKKDLEFYFNGYASEMRKEGLNQFPGQFTASRKVHALLQDIG